MDLRRSAPSLARPTAKAPATPAAAAPPPRSPRRETFTDAQGYESTAAVSRDSGSDSALTASESALTSSGVSSS